MKKIKLLSIFLCLMLLAASEKQLSYASETEATDPFQVPSVYYINIAGTSAGITNIGGKASCSAGVEAYSSSASLRAFIYLEKKNSNGTWSTYNTDYASKTGSGLLLQTSFTVSPGTYRVRAQLYVNGESATKITASKTF